MGLVPWLTVTLFCLLACTSSLVHGCNITVGEIIQSLNFLLDDKTWCIDEVTVADVFTADKNTTEKEILCRAASVLHSTAYKTVPVCLAQHKTRDLSLKGLSRNLRGTVQSDCSMTELKKSSTLRDFLEKLRRIMRRKYNECRRRLF